MNYIKIILENTASNGLSGRIVEGFDSFKRYNRGKNLVKVELKNFELDPGEHLEVGFVQCNESGQTSEAVETVSFAPSLMSTTDDPKVYVAKVPDELFMSDATHYNVEIRRVSYADVDIVEDVIYVDPDAVDSASVGTVSVSARSLTREGTEPNVGDFAAIQDKVDDNYKRYAIRTLTAEPTAYGYVDGSAVTEQDGIKEGDFLLYDNRKLYRVTMLQYSPDGVLVTVVGTFLFEFKEYASMAEVGTLIGNLTIAIGDVEKGVSAHKTRLNTVEAIAKGAQQAKSFPNYQKLIDHLNDSTNDELYKIGQSFYIETLDVPDLWISLWYASGHVDYTYVDDETFVNELKANGHVLVGAYYLAPLETGKVDLSGFPTREEVTTNLRNGTGRGSIEQPMWLVGDGNPLGAKATGEGAVALGGQRYDKAGKDVADEPQTEAKGTQSFAHGGGVIVEGDWGAGFGKDTRSYQRASHSEGGGTQAGMTYDEWLTANGKTDTTANQEEYKKSYGFAHAEGETTKAKGRASHAEGKSTQANADNAHSEGFLTQANGNSSHAEGNQSKSIGDYSHAENYATQAIGDYSHAEGVSVKAIGKASHAEGTPATDESGNVIGGQAFGEASHIEGYACETTESANASHAEGYDSKTYSRYAHAEGTHTRAGIENPVDEDDGVAAHAEGNTTTASGQASHSEGLETTASGDYAHAEGQGTVASGQGAHAQNRFTEATAGSASAAGFHTKAGYMYQFVVGAFNDNKEGNIFEVGGGTQESDRKNAFEVNVSGEAYVYGKKLLTEDDSTGSGGTQLYMHAVKFSDTGMPLSFISTKGTAYTDYYSIFTDFSVGILFGVMVDGGNTAYFHCISMDWNIDTETEKDYILLKGLNGSTMTVNNTLADYTPKKL